MAAIYNALGTFGAMLVGFVVIDNALGALGVPTVDYLLLFTTLWAHCVFCCMTCAVIYNGLGPWGIKLAR